MSAIRSSHVLAIAYGDRTVSVTFKNKGKPKTYQYLDVPPLLQRGLAVAKSKGGFLHRYIIPHKKVRVVET